MACWFSAILDEGQYPLIAGVPVGREIPQDPAYSAAKSFGEGEFGSINVVIAADAPLVAHQLKRVGAKSFARTGAAGVQGNGSGDVFVAFSTANPGAAAPDHVVDLKMLPNDRIEPIFAATIQATEEAVVNAMIAADTMTGINNHRVIALPHDELRAVLKKRNRLQ